MSVAYSYLRFSTPEQRKGDSARRQIELAKAYAKEKGLILDENLTFQDLGISAFRGKHAKEGALANFIKAAESGRVQRGSFLLVENLDRLSRQEPIDALDQMRRILALGITIVTLHDRKVHTKESLRDIATLLTSILSMHTANEESEKKSQRIRASWTAKRRRATAEKVPLTGACPSWISLDAESGRFKLDKAKAAVVKRIFEEAVHGVGHHRIARIFNEEGIPSIGRGKSWHDSYVQKILNNDAVIGMYQPHTLQETADGKKMRVPEGDPIPDYFPAAISKSLYMKVRGLRVNRRNPVGRKGDPNGNLFTGLARCGKCDSPMHFVNKGYTQKGGQSLVCSKARVGLGCIYRSWNYRDFENVVLAVIHQEIDWEGLSPRLQERTMSVIESLEEQQANIRLELAEYEKKIERIIDEVVKGGASPLLTKRRNEYEVEFKALALREKGVSELLNVERERLQTSEVDVKESSQAFSDWMSRHTSDTRRRSKGDTVAETQRARQRLASVLRENVSEVRLNPKMQKRGRMIKITLRPGLSNRPYFEFPFESFVTLSEAVYQKHGQAPLLPTNGTVTRKSRR